MSEIPSSTQSPRKTRVDDRGRLQSQVYQLTEELSATRTELREVMTQFEAIYDHHFQLTGLIDSAGRLIKANRTALKMVGAEPEDVLGRFFWDTPWWTHSAVEQQRLQGLIVRALDGHPGHFETTHRSSTGQTRVIDFRICPVHDENGKVKWLVPEGIDITEHKKTEQSLQEALHNWQSATEATIKTISVAVESRDPYTAGHQKRVARLASAIGTGLGLAEKDIAGLEYAGLVHDIGKISVPSEILSSPGKLSVEAMAMVRLHCKVGYDILSKANFPWPLARAALEHHERMDGSGYPQGLFGEQISLEARIIAVADVVEAMASHRPYRPTLGLDSAVQEISQGRKTKFDSAVVDACLTVLKSEAPDPEAYWWR